MRLAIINKMEKLNFFPRRDWNIRLIENLREIIWKFYQVRHRAYRFRIFWQKKISESSLCLCRLGIVFAIFCLHILARPEFSFNNILSVLIPKYHFMKATFFEAVYWFSCFSELITLKITPLMLCLCNLSTTILSAVFFTETFSTCCNFLRFWSQYSFYYFIAVL